ncbi:YceD family protein [Martelella limonii]|uniref:YceD family protein n=1 Tax=Martelella limonii TaxID=1647649 RepID=UPI001580A313
MAETFEKSLPFSRPFPVARASAVAFDMKLETDERERAATADFLDVRTVDALSAELRISPWRRDGVRVRGTVRAEITQSCVVTLEPIEAVIEEDVDATFLPETSRHFQRKVNEEGELIVDPDGPDEPEPFSGSEIDIAALVVEAIGLAIDPYPRKEGAAVPEEFAVPEDDADEEAPPSPFAALKNWKGDAD